MRRSYKFRLRPTKKQEAALSACLEDTREFYNAALEERREAWRVGRHRVTFYSQQAQLKEIRADDPERYGRWSSTASEPRSAAWTARSRASSGVSRLGRSQATHVSRDAAGGIPLNGPRREAVPVGTLWRIPRLHAFTFKASAMSVSTCTGPSRAVSRPSLPSAKATAGT